MPALRFPHFAILRYAIPLAIATAAATWPAAAQTAYEPGLTFRLFDIQESMDRLYPLVEGQTPNLDEKRAVIDYTSVQEFGGIEDRFIVECSGWLNITMPGKYGFRLTSDDGSQLTIDEKFVVQHDGIHAATDKEGEATLASGRHPFQVRFFEETNGQRLRLQWKSPGADFFVTVPPEVFVTEAGVTRVVAPGKKNIVRPGGNLRPGSGEPLAGVHPAWTVTTIHPAAFRPQVGAMAFHPDGRLLVATFQPNQNRHPAPMPGGDGKIWALTGVSGNHPEAIGVQEVASGLSEPLGMAFIRGALYVSQRLALTRLEDRDGDGYYETQVAVGGGWKADNYHQFHFGILEKDGFAYTTLSTTISFASHFPNDKVRGLNGPNPPHRGTLVRTNLATGEVAYLAGGLRTPNGLAFGPEGLIFNCDNQGGWQPTSKLQILEPGHFYGFYNNITLTNDDYPGGGAPSLFADQPLSPPVVYFPQNELANSPSQPLLIPGGEFAGQMLVGDITLGGIQRVFLEKVKGVWQGCAFRFTQGLEGGVNRLLWGPDGALYVGCMGATGNWSWKGTTFGLQRMNPKTDGTRAFEMKTVKAAPDGLIVEYTKPLHAGFAGKPGDFVVKQWTYTPTADYGGPKIDEGRLDPTAVSISDDRLTVHLTLPGMKKGYVVYLRAEPKSSEGEILWSTEAWYTLNEF